MHLSGAGPSRRKRRTCERNRPPCQAPRSRAAVLTAAPELLPTKESLAPESLHIETRWAPERPDQSVCHLASPEPLQSAHSPDRTDEEPQLGGSITRSLPSSNHRRKTCAGSLPPRVASIRKRVHRTTRLGGFGRRRKLHRALGASGFLTCGSSGLGRPGLTDPLRFGVPVGSMAVEPEPGSPRTDHVP